MTADVQGFHTCLDDVDASREATCAAHIQVERRIASHRHIDAQKSTQEVTEEKGIG